MVYPSFCSELCHDSINEWITRACFLPGWLVHRVRCQKYTQIWWDLEHTWVIDYGKLMWLFGYVSRICTAWAEQAIRLVHIANSENTHINKYETWRNDVHDQVQDTPALTSESLINQINVSLTSIKVRSCVCVMHAATATRHTLTATVWHVSTVSVTCYSNHGQMHMSLMLCAQTGLYIPACRRTHETKVSMETSWQNVHHSLHAIVVMRSWRWHHNMWSAFKHSMNKVRMCVPAKHSALSSQGICLHSSLPSILSKLAVWW